MIITGIESQKKDTSRYSIFVDGVFAFGLIMQDILYFKLKEGEEITLEKYDFIMQNIIYIKAQNVAIQYIGYKMRTEKEVCRKLSEKEYSEEVIQKVVAFLKTYHYLDDYEYCCKYIKESIKLKPKGSFLIKMELKERGVAQEDIERALMDSEIDELSLAVRLIHKKIADMSEVDDKKKRQVFSMLQRKGFSLECIKRAFVDAQRECDI